jgi:hypothetical protein
LFNNIDYSLLIRDRGSGEEIVYDGPFISDITDYFSNAGRYLVLIKGKHGNVESNITFDIIIV